MSTYAAMCLGEGVALLVACIASVIILRDVAKGGDQ